MPSPPAIAKTWGPSVETFLLGNVDFHTCLALQNRLVYEAGGRADGQISLLLCEHPPAITVGRSGSRAHVRLSPGELNSRQLQIDWVNRGGGAVLHLPGQLAVYPIVPLEPHGWSVGEYLRRFEAGLLATLEELGVRGSLQAGCRGIWGRSGQLVILGAAVKNWITYHGAFINVAPAMGGFRSIDTDPIGGSAMSSLVVERQQPVKMTTVRAALIGCLAAALECERYHIYSGHPLLPRLCKAKHESNARAV